MQYGFLGPVGTPLLSDVIFFCLFISLLFCPSTVAEYILTSCADETITCNFVLSGGPTYIAPCSCFPHFLILLLSYVLNHYILCPIKISLQFFAVAVRKSQSFIQLP